MYFRRSLLLAALVALVALSGPAVAQELSDLVTVPRAWASHGTTYGTTDSLAACRLASGQVVVFATAKKGDRVDLFDAADGKFIRSFGQTGTAAGEFKQPNGIVTVRLSNPARGTSQPTPRSLVLVVERDNRRVQAFCPDTLRPAGMFGAEELKRPYGAAVSYRPEGTFLYVTQADVPPSEAVHVYRLVLEDEGLRAEHVQAFGDEAGPGAIGEAESVVVDDELDRVLLCDEVHKNVKVYERGGRFTGTTLGDGLVVGDPEGIVLWAGEEAGYVMLTDQRKTLTVWHVFERRTLRYVTAFTGRPRIANTDGICVYAEPLGPFSAGLLLAVNNDAEVCSYSLADVADIVRRAAPREAAPPTALGRPTGRSLRQCGTTSPLPSGKGSVGAGPISPPQNSSRTAHP